MKEILLREKTIQDWSPFTLAERVQIMQKVWGERVKISVTTLRKFYQNHNVRFRTARQAYKLAMNKREELDAERKEFAKLLANIIAKELPLIYVDETTFNN